MDEKIVLRNAKEALRWKIFPEHRLDPDEFERRYTYLMNKLKHHRLNW